MREMAEQLSLDLVEKGLVTAQIVITVGYDRKNLEDPVIASQYDGDTTTDFYGRTVPKHAHGSINLPRHTSSSRLIVDAALELFDSTVNPHLLARRLNITACDVKREQESTQDTPQEEQLELFADYDKDERANAVKEQELSQEHRRQEAILAARRRFGKNAVLKGTNLQEGATQTQRNKQIGGHQA